jgi:hypothetical protein
LKQCLDLPPETVLLQQIASLIANNDQELAAFQSLAADKCHTAFRRGCYGLLVKPVCYI